MIDLTGYVAVVTGAGAGLGRSHALALAKRGASVVINDMNQAAAAAVCAEIEATGKQAMADGTNVTDPTAVTAMMETVCEKWGKVDILVNNAGILRDRSFAKMDLDDFRSVLDVHLMGSVNCVKAVWAGMRERKFGRILFTTSSSGLYGNFGQSNYGSAKMGLVGLMQTLAIEGARDNIHVNCLAPSAATAMTNGLYPEDALEGMGPELVSPAVVALCAPGAPTRKIILAGAGSFEMAHITMTRGIVLRDGDIAEQLLSSLDAIGDRTGDMVPDEGSEQYRYEVASTAALQPSM